MKNFLKISSLLITLAGLSNANAQNKVYKFEKNHTSVLWTANHFGYSKVSGKFVDVDGSITFDEKAPKNSKVEATINMNSIVTGLPKFDEHLKSKDFFDVKTYPTAKFVSKKVEITKGNSAYVYGDLTLLGKTRELILSVTFNKSAPNPMNKKPTIGFSAIASINRSDFGMAYALPNIADNVYLNIEAEANQ